MDRIPEHDAALGRPLSITALNLLPFWVADQSVLNGEWVGPRPGDRNGHGRESSWLPAARLAWPARVRPLARERAYVRVRLRQAPVEQDVCAEDDVSPGRPLMLTSHDPAVCLFQEAPLCEAVGGT